jgi:hypothetical protein
MEPEGPRLKDLFLSWAKSLNSNPPPPIPLPQDPFFILRLDLPSGSFPQVSPQNTPMHLSSPPHMLHAFPIAFSIWSPEKYFVKITDQ